MTEPGRVLIVDDSEDDQLHIRRILRDEFHVTAAYSASEALERLEHQSFDALVSDQKMPRVTGAELIGKVKGRVDTRDLRCILLSGRTSDEQLVSILRDGRIYHYFDKDNTLLTNEGRNELVLAVRNAVKANRLQSEREELNRRLSRQVDALSGQYKLLRTLLTLNEPVEVLRLVLESLVEQLDCRGAIVLVDLLPNQGVYGQVALKTTGPRLNAEELVKWRAWVGQTYTHLSGRRTTAELRFERVGKAEEGGEASLVPHDHAPLVPILVNRDLRGLLAVIREDNKPLRPDEKGILQVWSDQLQDALTRVHTQRLDEQRRIELMVETMTEGVILTDEHGAVTLMNPAARRMLDIQRFDRPDFNVIVSAMGLSSLDVLRQLGVGESKVAWRELRLGEDYFQVLFSHVRDASGDFVGVLTVVRHVTAQKVAEHRREEFVHIIGHELRSPLTSIGGVLDLLSKQVLGELNGRQREYVEMARDSCLKINQLLNDLLDLAKFEKGRMPLSVEQISLEQVVEEGVRKFEPVSIETGVELEFSCELEGLLCEADPARLTQVISNLLSNALKFTNKGGKVSVEVFAALSAPDLYLVAVHNTGDEIPEADLDRVFDKFEQVALQDRRSVGGTGLGLSICRNIIEGHSGRIWVESGVGEGTTFVFSLPAHAGERDGQGESPQGTSVAEGQPILLICSERQEAYAEKAVLIDLGFQVRVCAPRLGMVRERVASQRPVVAMYLDLEGEPDPQVLSELAGYHDLPVVSVLPPGTPPPRSVDMSLELPNDPIVLNSMLNIVLARARTRRRLRVLILDRDADWAAARAEQLEEAGYLPHTASEGPAGVRWIENLLPDLVIVDPELPGLQVVLARLAKETESPIPVLYTGATPEGAPDALTGELLDREEDAAALLVKMRTLLAAERRGRAEALIVLPGSRELQREVQGRIRNRASYAYCAVDIVGLRDAIEALGFVWGLGTMAQTAELVHGVLREKADERAFLGQQRDDDFVFLVAPEHCETVCDEISRAFTRLEPALRDESELRLGVSITAIIDADARFDSFAALQAELSRRRGRSTGEVVFIDRGDELLLH